MSSLWAGKHSAITATFCCFKHSITRESIIYTSLKHYADCERNINNNYCQRRRIKSTIVYVNLPFVMDLIKHPHSVHSEALSRQCKYISAYHTCLSPGGGGSEFVGNYTFWHIVFFNFEIPEPLLAVHSHVARALHHKSVVTGLLDIFNSERYFTISDIIKISYIIQCSFIQIHFV